MNLVTRICLPNLRRLSFALGFALAIALPASAQFPLQQNDVVCLIGNALADRMQHDGWMETLIQSPMAGKNLSFRNLAVSGDTVTSRPRSKGVPSPEDYLARCKADVIFVIFGCNKSFGGEPKPAQFKSDLAALLESPEPHARTAAAAVKDFWGPADPTKGTMQTQIADIEEKIKVPKHLTGQMARAYRIGGLVYHSEAHCATCHQPDGKGLDPAFPPLVGSPWVTGSEERFTKIALHGLHGKIEVNGKVYDPEKGVPPMTSFEALLGDDEMAAVLTYVGNSWGNKAAPVLPETVKKIRAANKNRSTFWKPEELLKVHPTE